MIDETYYDIPNFEGKYAISKSGEVKSLARKIDRFGGFICKERRLSKALTKNKYY